MNTDMVMQVPKRGGWRFPKGYQQTNPRSLANLKHGAVKQGPSRYAMIVMRRLLNAPMTITQLECVTHLSRRCIQGQLLWLKNGGVLKRVALVPTGQHSGPVAVYRVMIDVELG